MVIPPAPEANLVACGVKEDPKGDDEMMGSSSNVSGNKSGNSSFVS